MSGRRSWPTNTAAGRLTALPVIETQAGDVSAYVPTNVISITDGQIYLEPEAFNAGIRPAVNVGLSVSRVGGSAQTRAIRSVAGRLRLDLAQYSELATFAQFGTADLDAETRAQLERGQRSIEILKQPQYEPLSMGRQAIIFYALNNGYLDEVPIPQCQAFEDQLRRYVETAAPELEGQIMEAGDITGEIEEELKKALEEFKATFAAS